MNIANSLTISRMVLAPIFIVVFSFQSLWAYISCFVLSIIIEMTDFFDGKIARRYKQMSDFGKLMDPFADSISRFTIFLCFLSAGLAPLWMIAIFFYRDVLVAIVRVFSMQQGILVASRKSGKTKAFLQAICILLVLAALILKKMGIEAEYIANDASFQRLTTSIIGVAALITLWSGFDYWSANKRSVMLALKGKSPQ